jgi:hypothetical protein
MPLTPTRRRLKNRPRKVKNRKTALRRSGHSYTDLARLAAVTHSMAWKWMNGERVSAACERAFTVLTNGSQEERAS